MFERARKNIQQHRNGYIAGLGAATFLGCIMSVTVPIDAETQTNFVRIGVTCPGNSEPQLTRVETIRYLDASTSRGSIAVRCVLDGIPTSQSPVVEFEDLDGKPISDECPRNRSNAQEYVFRVNHTENDFVIGSSDPLEIKTGNPEGPDILTIRIPRIDEMADVSQDLNAPCPPIPQVRLSDGL